MSDNANAPGEHPEPTDLPDFPAPDDPPAEPARRYYIMDAPWNAVVGGPYDRLRALDLVSRSDYDKLVLASEARLSRDVEMQAKGARPSWEIDAEVPWDE